MSQPTQGFRGALSTRVVIAGTQGQLLVYKGTPGAGNLELSISSSAGTDPYGNAFPAGIGLHSVAGGPDVIGQLQWSLDNVVPNAAIFAGPVLPGLTLQGDTVIPGNKVHVRGEFSVNAGRAGGYLTESHTLTIVSLANNTLTNWPLTGEVNNAWDSDYPSGMSGTTTATWTCPVAGYYWAEIVGSSTANPVPSGTNGFLRILKNGATWAQRGSSGTVNPDGAGIVVGRMDLFAINDTLTFQADQATGGALANVKADVHIRRMV